MKRKEERKVYTYNIQWMWEQSEMMPSVNTDKDRNKKWVFDVRKLNCTCPFFSIFPSLTISIRCVFIVLPYLSLILCFYIISRRMAAPTAAIAKYSPECEDADEEESSESSIITAGQRSLLMMNVSLG